MTKCTICSREIGVVVTSEGTKYRTGTSNTVDLHSIRGKRLAELHTHPGTVEGQGFPSGADIIRFLMQDAKYSVIQAPEIGEEVVLERTEKTPVIGLAEANELKNRFAIMLGTSAKPHTIEPVDPDELHDAIFRIAREYHFKISGTKVTGDGTMRLKS